MADLAWHRKYHPGRVCDFSDAVDYNAYMLNAIERQIDASDTDRERQKTAYRRRYALNEYEFELLSSGECPAPDVGFEDLESESVSVSEPELRMTSSSDAVSRLKTFISDQAEPTTGEILVWQDGTYQVTVFQTWGDDDQRKGRALIGAPESTLGKAVRSMENQEWEDRTLIGAPWEGDKAPAKEGKKGILRSLGPAQRKKWMRRAVLGGLAASTLAVAGAFGYWAFKPKTKTPSAGMIR